MTSRYEELRQQTLERIAALRQAAEAKIIPLPTGTALTIAKQDRTSAEEISKAMEEARQARDRKEKERAERQAQRDRENEEQRMQMLRNMNSEASMRAAADFNNRMGYYRGNHMNRDDWQGDEW